MFNVGQWVTFVHESRSHSGFILGFVNDVLAKVAIPATREVVEVYRSQLKDNESIQLKRVDFESIEDLAIASRDSIWFNQAKERRLTAG